MSQGWCAKQIDRDKAKRIKRNGNTFKGVMARSSSTFAEKAQAFKAYKDLMHGFRHGNFVNEGGVRWVGRDGKGLPSEGYDDAKFDVAVVRARDEKVTAKRVAKVTSKVAMVVQAAPQVAKWSRRGGFASR